jgi:intein-encoded DNA endonuclease-like protein
MLDNKKRLTNSDIKDICLLYRKGESTCVLSKKFNVRSTSIIYQLRKHRVRLRSRSEALKIGFKMGRVKIQKHEIPFSSKIIIPQKSYLIGVLCGDGYIDFSPKRQTFQVGLQAIDKEFVAKFGDCIKFVYNIEPAYSKIKPKNKNWSIKYQARACSKNICLDLLNYSTFKRECWKTPAEIKKSSYANKCWFLRGFYDSEGDVDEKYYRLGLTSINLLGLQEIKNILNELGIRSSLLERKIYANRKRAFVLRIQDRKSIQTFYNKIGFTIYRKQQSLKRILKSYKLHKTLNEKILELEPQMIKLRNKNYSYSYISKRLNLPVATVWNHLNKKQT